MYLNTGCYNKFVKYITKQQRDKQKLQPRNIAFMKYKAIQNNTYIQYLVLARFLSN